MSRMSSIGMKFKLSVSPYPCLRPPRDVPLDIGELEISANDNHN